MYSICKFWKESIVRINKQKKFNTEFSFCLMTHNFEIPVIWNLRPPTQI